MLRAADVLAALLAVVVRVVRAAFAASPRVAAAPADAERDAGVRFEAGLGASGAGVSDSSALLRVAVADFVAAALAAAVFAAAADFVVRGFAVDFAAVVFEPGFAAVVFDPDFAAADFAPVVFEAAGLAALDFAAAVRGLDDELPACPDGDSRWSDTPMPVPSADSSS
ncbi:hypothetical protein [Agromyces neolithicus]|uniref:Uncharacterized protein n=1 Tax=Agromyces neolithicus TaxID=269420 RepID=A0ABN2MB52_9MICO